MDYVAQIGLRRLFLANQKEAPDQDPSGDLLDRWTREVRVGL